MGTSKYQPGDRQFGIPRGGMEDTAMQKPVLIVYQYPVGESGIGTRIELVIDQEPEQCIKSAEHVLILSSDLISRR